MDAAVSPQKGRRYERESYSVPELEALLEQTEGRRPAQIRNHALIVTMWETGARVSEALDLRPSDLDLRNRRLLIRHGKGGKQRTIELAPSTVEELQLWLDVRSHLSVPPRSPLFCTLAGGRLQTSYVRDTLKTLAERAGWERRIHPHGLRHTYAASLVRQNVSPEMIRRQLGHSSLSTTSIYLSTISSEDIAHAMESVDFRR